MSSNHPGSRVAAVTACYIVPIPLEILATGLRIYARRRQGRTGRDRFATDDFFILFATVRAYPMFDIFRSPFPLDPSKPDTRSLDLRPRPVLRGPGLWSDELPKSPRFASDLRAGPPHGFGKHIDQVSAHDFETFEVVRKYLTAAEPSGHTELTQIHPSRATISSAISTM